MEKKKDKKIQLSNDEIRIASHAGTWYSKSTIELNK